MQDIRSTYGPDYDKVREAEASRMKAPTTLPPLFNLMAQILAATKDAQTLQKFNTIIDTMLEKLLGIIDAKNVTEAIEKLSFGTLPGELRKMIDQKFNASWKQANDVANLLNQLKDAFNKQDHDKTAALLLKFTESQVGKEALPLPKSIQDLVNQALQPFMQNKTDEALLKLFLTDLLKEATKEFGHSLPKLKEALAERLLNQILTMPDRQTLFKDASNRLLELLQTPEGEQMVIALVGGQLSAGDREKIKNQVQALQVSPKAKKGLESGSAEASKLTKSEEAKEAAKNDEIESLLGNVYVKQIVDPTYAKMLDDLQNILNILAKNYDPKSLEGAKIQQLLQNLQKIRDAYAQGNWDFPDLGSVLTDPFLVRLINGIQGRDARIDCLKKIGDMLSTFKGMIVNGDQALNDAINQATQYIANYRDVTNVIIDNMQTLDTLISQIIASGGQVSRLSPEDYNNMLKAYIALMSQYSKLTPDDRKALDAITKVMQSTTITDSQGRTANIMQVMVDSMFYEMVKEICIPGTDFMDILRDRFRDMVGALEEQAKTNPALKPLVDELKKYEPISENTTGIFGMPFFIVRPDGIEIAKSHISTSTLSFDTQKLSALQKAFDNLRSAVSSTRDFYQQQLPALQRAKDELAALIKPLGPKIDDAIRDVARALWVWTNSLPDVYADVILDRFLPAQEARLWALAQLLSYYNINGRQDNSFISAISGWDLAGSQLNCGSTGSPTCYADELNIVRERTKQTNDLKALFDSAKKELADKLKNGEITQAQYDESMKRFLGDPKATPPIEGWDAQLKTTVENLGKLQTQLEKIAATVKAIDEARAKGDTGRITGLTAQLEQFKKDIGPLESAARGSLTRLYGAIDGDANRWTSLGQNQQLVLQLNMTQMTQIFSTVATGLNMLNQMYMTIARGINPR